MRFTTACTPMRRGTIFFPFASRRSSTANGSPCSDSSMTKLIFSREKPGASTSPRSAMRP